MGQEYSMEMVERAEQLYCVDGQTFDAVATLTGVAASTLKRWSEAYKWQEKKEQIRQALSAIRTNTILLRAKLIENCMSTLHAQDAFAVSAIESLAQRAAQSAAKTGPGQGMPENLREIRTDEDAICALEEALQIRVNRMVADPAQLNFSAMKDLKQVMDLVRDLRSQHVKTSETGKSRGLTPDAADKIRRDILGIKNN